MARSFVFNTRRLTVRPLRATDFAACRRTKLMSVLSKAEAGGATLAVSHDDASSFGAMARHRRTLMETDEGYYFGVFRRFTGEFVGEVMLFEISRGRNQNASIGAVIYSHYRRNGYAKEALRALVRFAFLQLGLHRIEGQADPDNHASIGLCTKAGFRIECVSPRRIRENGRWKDMTILSITREEL